MPRSLAVPLLVALVGLMFVSWLVWLAQFVWHHGALCVAALLLAWLLAAVYRA